MAVLSLSFAKLPLVSGRDYDCAHARQCLQATSFSTSKSHPGFCVDLSVSIFLTRPSTFLRRASTVSFENSAIGSAAALSREE